MIRPRLVKFGTRFKNWKPSLNVDLEAQGDKFTALPFLEYIVKRASWASGTCLPDGPWDASWEAKNRADAERLFARFVDVLKKVRFSRYFKLRVLHDYDQTKRLKTLKQFRRGRFQKPKRRRNRAAIAAARGQA